ncbi:MAG: hypothetical protein P1V19_12365 [Gimesia sp.]|nr:hypothetical protein [Gimesia sp.]
MKTTGKWPVSKNRQASARIQNKVARAEQEDALDQTLIADLSNEQIHQMTHEELARVIRAAKLDFLDLDGRLRVNHFERNTLERLAYLARFCCQNQMSRTF